MPIWVVWLFYLSSNWRFLLHAKWLFLLSGNKAKAVVEELRSMKLKASTKKVEDDIEETLTYCDFPLSTGLASAPIM